MISFLKRNNIRHIVSYLNHPGELKLFYTIFSTVYNYYTLGLRYWEKDRRTKIQNDSGSQNTLYCILSEVKILDFKALAMFPRGQLVAYWTPTSPVTPHTSLDQIQDFLKSMSLAKSISVASPAKATEVKVLAKVAVLLRCCVHYKLYIGQFESTPNFWITQIKW